MVSIRREIRGGRSTMGSSPVWETRISKSSVCRGAAIRGGLAEVFIYELCDLPGSPKVAVDHTARAKACVREYGVSRRSRRGQLIAKVRKPICQSLWQAWARAWQYRRKGLGSRAAKSMRGVQAGLPSASTASTRQLDC